MATLRIKRKIAGLIRESCEEHSRTNLASNSNAPGSEEDYITQRSGELRVELQRGYPRSSVARKAVFQASYPTLTTFF